MKPLESNKVEKLLEILQIKPGQRVVHITSSSHILTKHLHQFCQTHNNAYYLYCTKDVFYDKCMTKYVDKSNIRIVKFDLRHPKYRMYDIDFDYLIATLDFREENKELFLEKCYPVIRRGGKIIIIIPNSKYPERDEWREILQKQHYISVNIINDLFEHYDVITAKRIDGGEIKNRYVLDI